VIQSAWFPDEAARVLVPGGALTGVMWNRHSPRGMMAHAKATWTRSDDFYKYSYERWKQPLLARGFSFIHEEGFCWFPFNRFSNSSWVPFFTRMEQRLGLRQVPRFSPWVAFIAQYSPVENFPAEEPSGEESPSRAG